MLRDIATQYTGYGLSIIPIGRDKIPMRSWTINQKEIIIPGQEFDNCESIGLVCGSVSGNIITIDIDLKYDITGTLYEDYKKEINLCDSTLLKKLTVQKTKNNGYHFIFRCKEIEGNLKLANRYVTKDEQEKNPKEKIKVLIETRGNLGYIIVAPSEGYNVVYGSFESIQEITPEQKQILYDCAKIFNEVREQKKDEHKQKEAIKTDWVGITAFDDYNKRGDVLGLLEKSGWKYVREFGDNIYLLRPGGEGKWSATWNEKLRIFYCFTSSSEFTQNTGYNPIQVYCYLNCNGDYSNAAKELYQLGFGERQKRKEEKKDAKLNYDDILKDSYIDMTVEVPKPPTILSIREVEGGEVEYKRMFTLGNFSCIIGKAKSKKTFALSMMSAAIIKGSDKNNKFKGERPEGKDLVVYIDTEQGLYDSHFCMKRIEKLAQTSKNFKSFNLRPYSAKERVEIVEHIFKTFGKEMCYCVIDGIADLARTFNDEVEATELTSMLMRLTADYNCHISTVIHQNKNDNYATGHLGSSIMKKSEMVISIEKGTQDPKISVVSADYSRSIGFNPFVMSIDKNGLPEVEDYVEVPEVKTRKSTKKITTNYIETKENDEYFKPPVYDESNLPF